MGQLRIGAGSSGSDVNVAARLCTGHLGGSVLRDGPVSLSGS